MDKLATFRQDGTNFIVRFEKNNLRCCKIVDVFRFDNLLIRGRPVALLPSCEPVKFSGRIVSLKLGTQGAADNGVIADENLVETLVVNPPA